MKGRGKRCTRRELKEKIKRLEAQKAGLAISLQMVTTMASLQINVMQMSFNARLMLERHRFNDGGIVPDKEGGYVIEPNTLEWSCLTKEQEQAIIALKEDLDAEFGTNSKSLRT